MIYTLGESLLDIIIDTAGNTVAKPGGAMLNVAVSLARAGNKVALITETGDDLTGKQIINFLSANGVLTELVTAYQNEKSSLALAFLDENKKPHYAFYKNYPQKRSLKMPEHFSSGDILLFGSLYALDQKISPHISKTIQKVAAAGGLVIYDPNIRKNDNLSADKSIIERYIAKARIIKGSDEDFENIFNTRTSEKVAAAVQKINRHAILFITLGAQGAVAFFEDKKYSMPAPEIKAVSTVGAGDGFSAGIIHALQRSGNSPERLTRLSPDTIKQLLKSGIDFATQVCMSEENYIKPKNVSP